MVIKEEIFRKYDIRGIVGKELEIKDAKILGRAAANYLLENYSVVQKKGIVVGQDVRVSSPKLSQNLIEGLLDFGIDVVFIGECSTPALYLATIKLGGGAGIMVTASHNPPEYNGFKFCDNTAYPISEEKIEEIKKIYLRIKDKDVVLGKRGKVKKMDFSKTYIDFMNDRFSDLKNLDRAKYKICVDYGNGSAALYLPQILKNLGIEHKSFFEEIDGNFPNRPPDPTQDKNIKVLLDYCKKNKVKIGFAFDGDADRLRVIINGKTVEGDVIGYLYCKFLLSKQRRARIVYEVKHSLAPAEALKKLGVEVNVSATGYGFIKKNIKKTNSDIGAELSGHFSFKDYYFIDDAIYSALHFLEFLEKFDLDASLRQLPKYYSTPEVRVHYEGDRDKVIAQVNEALKKEKPSILEIDGVRLNFLDGWILIRKSNNEPVLSLRAEAKTKKRLLYLISVLRQVFFANKIDLGEVEIRYG